MESYSRLQTAPTSSGAISQNGDISLCAAAAIAAIWIEQGFECFYYENK